MNWDSPIAAWMKASCGWRWSTISCRRLCPRHVALVDEAHTCRLACWKSPPIHQPRREAISRLVRLVLVGSPELEERFASPRLDSFSQRLAARCYLEAFQPLRNARITSSRGSRRRRTRRDIFPEPTCQIVYKATNGVPRLINQVCDHALFLAYVAGRSRSSRPMSKRLGPISSSCPLHGTRRRRAEQARRWRVIEFGALDDQPGKVPQPSRRRPDNDAPGLTNLSTRRGGRDRFVEPAEQIAASKDLGRGGVKTSSPPVPFGPRSSCVFRRLEPVPGEVRARRSRGRSVRGIGCGCGNVRSDVSSNAPAGPGTGIRTGV